jgi:RNase H-fold protein (predicted Holliday junction resolvase)
MATEILTLDALADRLPRFARLLGLDLGTKTIGIITAEPILMITCVVAWTMHKRVYKTINLSGIHERIIRANTNNVVSLHQFSGPNNTTENIRFTTSKYLYAKTGC